MQTTITFIHLLSLVCWIGSIVFFSFFTAPAVFITLGREQGGEMMSVLFPRYYGLGYACSVLAAATLLLSPMGATGLRLPFLIGMAACTFYAGLVISPSARTVKKQMKDEPENRETLEPRFQSLHAWSVRLNATVLILGLGLLWLTAAHFQS